MGAFTLHAGFTHVLQFAANHAFGGHKGNWRLQICKTPYFLFETRWAHALGCQNQFIECPIAIYQMGLSNRIRHVLIEMKDCWINGSGLKGPRPVPRSALSAFRHLRYDGLSSATRCGKL